MVASGVPTQLPLNCGCNGNVILFSVFIFKNKGVTFLFLKDGMLKPNLWRNFGAINPRKHTA